MQPGHRAGRSLQTQAWQSFLPNGWDKRASIPSDHGDTTKNQNQESLAGHCSLVSTQASESRSNLTMAAKTSGASWRTL